MGGAAAEEVLRRSGLPDPRAEPEAHTGTSTIAHAREKSAAAQAESLAHAARVADLERRLEEARRTHEAEAARAVELERTIEQMKRERAVDATKIAELTAEVARVDRIAKDAAQALEGVANAFDAVERARIEGGDARAATLEALSKLIG